MTEKHFELIRLYNSNGATVAVCYNRLYGYFKEYTFLWYSKKEIIRKLRQEYGVIVRRDAG